MHDSQKHAFKEQQAIRNKCFHPSGTFVEFPIEDVETSIPKRFEKIVRMYPDRLALKQGSRCFTYDRLNRAANRIAHLILAQRGRSPEPIGIYLKDQSAMIIALLGILKAGKFFLPLDPSYPKARNRFVIKDCGAEVIVTDQANIQSTAKLFGPEYQLVVMEDAEMTELDENPGISIIGDICWLRADG